MVYKYLDPRTRLINIFAIVLILFNVDNIYTFLLINLYILVLVVSSHEKGLHKILIPFIPMFFIMIIINSILIKTGAYLTSIFFVDIYTGAIVTTLIYFDRLVLICLLTYTTIKSMNNTQIVSGFKYIFKPLKYVKFPYETAALICAITLSFFPIVLEEIKRIRSAQILRGLNYKANFLKRIINFKAIIIPTFTFSFAKAINIGNALDIKGYDHTKSRTEYNRLKFRYFDYALYLLLLVFVVL